VAEARAIKRTRDRAAAEDAGRQMMEDSARAEAARLREGKIAEGLLGVCPVCKADVDTAEGVVLRHVRPAFAPYQDLNPPACEGTGEAPLAG
jgi:hypothetical protein